MTTGEALRLTLSWLATYGLHSTLFLGGAWLLCRLRPPRIDRNRERLWKLALVGGVLSATLQLGLGAQSPLGSFELEALSASRSAPARAARPELAAEQRLNDTPPHTEPESRAVEPARNEARWPETPLPGFAAALRPPLTDAAVEVARDAERSVPDAESGASAGVASVGKEHARSSLASRSSRLGAITRTLGARWPALVLGLWVALGLAGVTGLVASWTCLRARMLGRERLSDGPLLERFERLHARARVRRRVRLSVSARIAAPFSTGLLWPEVCLPRAVLTDLTPAQQEALLAHELAHLVRRDPAWFGIGFLIERLLFFQPLNRLARVQLAELAELACDDWAVRWTGGRLALASCLTEVAGWVIGERARLVTPPGLAGHRSRLGQRVERLLDERRSPAGEPAAPWWPPLAAGALALVALAG
ncbi:MAG: M56 family metallopeptidase, partial [Planctomycetes bacterium]|nr:M56 family metallopeptidase [Planctomycetota bacterium]